MVSIPRDSLMNVDNQYMKINAVALIAGKKALVSNVEQITGQKIDHVAQIKFGGLQNVVNALGGIELCYDEDVQDSYSGLNWKAGCHTADGSTALSSLVCDMPTREETSDATNASDRSSRPSSRRLPAVRP